MTQRTQASPLKWYTDQRYLHKNGLTNHEPYIDPVPQNQIPPFKFPREATGNSIIYFRLTNCATGVQTDITAEINQAGLTVQGFTNYDLIVYPATVKILGVAIPLGTYTAEMSDGITVWYSEEFTMVDDIGKFIEIEYCNRSAILYSGGRFDYQGGYRNRVFLNSRIGKPNYPTKAEAEERQARELYSEQISWKEYQFQVLVPEHVIDTLRSIWLHDEKTIRFEGIEYNAEKFEMSDPIWQESGLAIVDFTFITDTYIVKVASDTSEENHCVITPGSCVDVDQTAKDLLVVGSPAYLDFEYTDKDGATQSLQTGDYILAANVGGDTNLEQFNGTGYTSVLSLANNVVYEEAADIYYVNKGIGTGYVKPVIFEFTGGVATGYTLPNSINEIWYIRSDFNEFYYGTYSQAEIEAGVALTLPTDAIFLFLKVGTPLCGNFYRSASKKIIGVTTGCDIEIQGYYAGPSEAAADGVTADQYYGLAQVNVFGWPYGLVMQMAPTTTYDNDTDAGAGGVADDDCYAVSAGNDYDMTQFAVKVKNPGTTYLSNDDAGTNGIAFDEQYALGLGNEYSVPFEGFLIIRKF